MATDTEADYEACKQWLRSRGWRMWDDDGYRFVWCHDEEFGREFSFANALMREIARNVVPFAQNMEEED